VTLELLRAAINDYSKSVAVMADAQKGEEPYLTLPDGFIAILLGAEQMC